MIIPMDFISADQTGSSASACAAMVLRTLGVADSPETIAELFERTIFSRDYNAWYTHSIDTDKAEDSPMLSCIYFMVRTHYPRLSALICPLSIERVCRSHIKRGIPVVVSGIFPLVGGRIAHTIVLHGFVDDYFIVHDPRGNLLTGYTDRYGSNLLYPISILGRWNDGHQLPNMLRIITKED